ncbi:hypothetical protein C7974DRAFT_402938 [Boeremia exigua]|uniref:uncharacterized protein n=1 Tax=Boeremia exigua TaxID=749465 RepID=UPI001E8EABC7|nr:uncharacterized protein C7974DRAFT_402938 [Boeremia exigua]KAH6614937.1 hypothetical protein C7974DRAFT_402938 [Boeremia exigua]
MVLETVPRGCREGRSNTPGDLVVKGLLSLPPEILEIVYHHLDSIEDVHSFGRTHSKMYDVVKRQTIYTEIMRSIIGRSWAHRYDLQLCRVLKLHEEVVRHFQEGGKPFPVSYSQGGPSYNEWETKLASATTVPECAYGPCATCMPDGLVYEILARYQGMRVLEHMWLERQLQEEDFLSAGPTTSDQDLVRQYTYLLDRAQEFKQGKFSARSSEDPATLNHTKLNPDQRGRFYSAITFVWVLNELRWVLTNFIFPSRSTRLNDILDRCRADLTNRCHNPLLDQLDQHAVFTFMYHHLLPLHSPVLQDQNSSKLPLTLNTDWMTDGAQSARFLQLFLLAGQTYFQPPDLVDLAIRHKVSRSAPYPEVTLPATTTHWIRPSNSFAFPANIAPSDYKGRLSRLFDTHVSLINRSCFAQARADNVSHVPYRIAPTSSNVTGLASRYYVDSMVAAVEWGQSYDKDAKPAREIFAGEWQRRAMWSVWWWANSEDKARAIMARWR